MYGAFQVLKTLLEKNPLLGLENIYLVIIYSFEVASVLLLMAMIGAIVLARRDVMSKDISTGLPVDQELIEKSSEPLITNKN